MTKYDMECSCGCMVIPLEELRLVALAAITDPDSELAAWQSLMRKLGLRNHRLSEEALGDGVEWGYYPVVKDILNSRKCSWSLVGHPVAYLRKFVKRDMYRAGLWINSGRRIEIPRRRQDRLEAQMKPVSQLSSRRSDGSEMGYWDTFADIQFNALEADVVRLNGQWKATGNPCGQSRQEIDPRDPSYFAYFDLDWVAIGRRAGLDRETLAYLLDRAEGRTSSPTEATRKRLQRAMPKLRSAVLDHVSGQRLEFASHQKAA